MRKCPPLQTARGNFLIPYQMILLPNIDFLISKQNKTPKIDPKNAEAAGWSCYSVLCFLQNRALQSNINKPRSINKYLYCNELQLFSV